MRISKLRLSGFKSFVEPAELLIEPGLTGVVGPNGCGKSNLLEAIRWTMGEASPKSLRGGGMEDVIFAGTATRPARDFAEVSILTEGEEGEAEVVRRIERGAGSAYRINGRDVRQRDVALLFADAATGAHSPALVSQGRIAAVIAAKPAERRQMLEEAAGIAGLHVRRREAEQRLRATEANLQRLDDMLAEMAARGSALRRQAKAAERYRILSADIRLAEARALFARWREATAAAEAAARQAEAGATAVAAAAEAQRAAAAWQAEAQRGSGAARAAAQATREAATAALHARTTLDAEREGLARRLDELARQREALDHDRAREDTLAVDAAAALARLADEDKALGRALAEAKARSADIEARVTTAEGAARDGEVALAQALSAEAAEQAEIRVADAALATARQLAARLAGERERVDREAAGLGDPATFEAALTAAGAARTRAEAASRAAGEALAAAEAEREQAAAARDVAAAASGEARAALAALEAEARALAASQPAGGDRVLDRIRAAPGYERALAAALGDDLDAPLGEKGWAGAALDAADPALPDGVEPLAAHVEAPPALARRLAQIGMAERDAGAALAVGQRLVTRDGRLRRWDGFVAREGGAAAAERLIRANRLAALEQALPAARDAARDAVAAAASASAVFEAAGAAIAAAKRRLAETDAAARRAARDEDAAAAALDRHRAAAAAIGQRRDRVLGEQADAQAAEAQARDARDALPDGRETRARVEAARTEGEAARARLADARGQAAALAQAIERDAARRETARGEAKGWSARAGDAAGRIAEMDRRGAAIEAETVRLADRPAALDRLMADAVTALDAAERASQAARDDEMAREAALREAEARAVAAGEAFAAAREHRAGAAARAENLDARRIELGRLSGERFECPASILGERVGFDPVEVGAAEAEQGRHDRLAIERERLGPVNLVAEQELKELDEGRLAAAAERDELGEAINRLRGSIGSLNREGRTRLLAAFEAVDGHFRRLFTTLFAGGEAHLALVDADDPLEAGLEIMAQPPGKRLGSLTLLSGGEQALTAIALIFALFLTNPAPICVLDEVDAPLDDANIERFCDLLDAMVGETDTRYLIVTHNAVTMSRMHRLFGVTMVERGVSRLVSVDLGGAETLLAAA